MMSPGDSHRVAATSTRTHKHTRTHVTSFTFQRTNTRPDSWTALQSLCGQSMTCWVPVVVVDDRVTMSSSRATRARLGSRMEEARSLTVLIPSRQLGGAVLPRGFAPWTPRCCRTNCRIRHQKDGGAFNQPSTGVRALAARHVTTQRSLKIDDACDERPLAWWWWRVLRRLPTIPAAFLGCRKRCHRVTQAVTR